FVRSPITKAPPDPYWYSADAAAAAARFWPSPPTISMTNAATSPATSTRASTNLRGERSSRLNICHSPQPARRRPTQPGPVDRRYTDVKTVARRRESRLNERALRRRGPAAPTFAAAALGAALVLVPGFDNGGFFPGTWAWTTLACSCLAGLRVVLRGRVSLSRAEQVLLTALAALTLWTLLSGIWAVRGAAAGLEARRGLLYLAALA